MIGLISCSVFPSPDDHVAVGTHGRTSPCRDVFCHLDQAVLIFRVGLRHRSGWHRPLWDSGTSITFHTERWGDQSHRWTVACRRMKKDLSPCSKSTKTKIVRMKRNRGQQKRLRHHKGCVCCSVCFSLRWVSSLTSALFVYSPSGCHGSALS